jgi:hypothetical protein
MDSRFKWVDSVAKLTEYHVTARNRMLRLFGTMAAAQMTASGRPGQQIA